MFDCKRCGEIKPKEAFVKVQPHKNKRGVNSYCKSCQVEINREYFRQNPEKAAKWKRANKVRSYGITVDQYQQMISAQDNRCAICGDVSERALDIDHCHTTGKVRGLLCSYCNKAIGMFKDNYEYLEAAIKYLKQHDGMK